MSISLANFKSGGKEVSSALLYKHYVKMAQGEKEWINELRDFIENYEFRALGV